MCIYISKISNLVRIQTEIKHFNLKSELLVTISSCYCFTFSIIYISTIVLSLLLNYISNCCSNHNHTPTCICKYKFINKAIEHFDVQKDCSFCFLKKTDPTANQSKKNNTQFLIFLTQRLSSFVYQTYKGKHHLLSNMSFHRCHA